MVEKTSHGRLLGNHAHQRALRVTFKDRTYQMHREDINNQQKRATPTQWAKYTITRCTIRMLKNAVTPIARYRKYTLDKVSSILFCISMG